MKLAIAVVALVGCGGPGNVPPPNAPPWPGSGPPGAPPPTSRPLELTVDGRLIEHDSKPLWCYADKSGSFGGNCFDVRDKCTKALEDVHLRAMAGMDVKLEKSVPDPTARRDAAARWAVTEWPPCKESDAMACMRVRDILTNTVVRICDPTIASCERGLLETKQDANYLVESPRCFVLRVP